jgi:hypothetical protein
MNFSIILNSRCRTELLNGLFDNILQKTSNLDDIEVLVNFDNDDIDSLIYTSSLYEKNHPICKILKFEFKQRDGLLIKGYNQMVGRASGDFIFVLNDDARIDTQDWDIISYPLLKTFNDDIVYGYVSDDSCDKERIMDYASFPIISKKATDILGFFMDERFVGLGADPAIYRVYMAVNRVVRLPIHIQHLWHQTVDKVINTDDVAKQMRQKCWSSYIDPWTLDINPDIQKLQKAIDAERKNIICN